MADASDIRDAFEPDPVRLRRSGLRILCLHGHGSNNDISHLQVEFLKLREAHGVSCDYLHAATEASPQSSIFEHFSSGPFFTWFAAWWPFSSSYGIGAPGGSLYESLHRIMWVVKEHGPYDGVYGFSQGGFMAAALCNRTIFAGLFGLPSSPFRFAILSHAGAGRAGKGPTGGGRLAYCVA